MSERSGSGEAWRVVLTGASSGIGESTAYAFARQGASLFLTARREDRLAQVSQECLRLGATRTAVDPRDLALPGQGGTLVRRALSELGGIEILVCNAGYGVYGPLQEVDPEVMARLMQVNFQSGYESIHAALPHFLERGRGHIVLVSSVLGKTPLPLGSPYCASKFAQVGLGESLWGELRGSGVEVSVICPGYTRTEFQRVSLTTAGASMFKRVGGNRPETVAQAILRAVRRRKRVVVLTIPGRILYLLHRLLPGIHARLTAWYINRNRGSSNID